MAVISAYMLNNVHITLSGSAKLDGVRQGDGTHLVGKTITLNSPAWVPAFFTDQNVNSAKSGDVVKVDYSLVLRDPASAQIHVAYGVNLMNSCPTAAKVEGLCIVDGPGGFPPVGVALQVVRATEADNSGQAAVPLTNLAYPVCFAAGTLILTPHGQMPVELLQPLDQVLTRDHGPQQIRWTGCIALSAEEVTRRASLRPVEIDADAFGEGLPARRLRVSQQHRILISGWKAELMFGTDEVLVAARDLINDQGIGIAAQAFAVSYHHILLDQHEVIWAEGVETESLYPVGLGPMNLPSAQMAELEMLFPDLFDDMSVYGATARPCLKPWEGRVLAP